MVRGCDLRFFFWIVRMNEWELIECYSGVDWRYTDLIGLRLCIVTIVNINLLVITSGHYEPVTGGAPIWKSISPRNTRDQFFITLRLASLRRL